MNQALDDIFAAIARMPGGDEEKSRLRDKARRYHRACGCALSGAFLILAIFASLIGLVLADPFRWSLIPVCLAGSIAAAVAGKAIGIGWGKARLSYLRRSLVRQTAT
jgi:hypothetical protein